MGTKRTRQAFFSDMWERKAIGDPNHFKTDFKHVNYLWQSKFSVPCWTTSRYYCRDFHDWFNCQFILQSNMHGNGNCPLSIDDHSTPDGECVLWIKVPDVLHQGVFWIWRYLHLSPLVVDKMASVDGSRSHTHDVYLMHIWVFVKMRGHPKMVL